MNDPSHRDFACAGLAVRIPYTRTTYIHFLTLTPYTQYGNQVELHYQFSSAAILVVIPPSSERISTPMARGELDFKISFLDSKSAHRVCPKCAEPRRVKYEKRYYCSKHITPYVASWQMRTDDSIHCVVPGCDFSIGSPFGLGSINFHYRDTHMCDPSLYKGKKTVWLSVERARELGLGDLDQRGEVVCLDSEGEEG